MRSRSAEAKHVLHRVESGRLTDDPAGRAHGTACKRVPAVGAMGQLQALAESPEAHGVLADHVTGALREHRDLLAGAFAGQAPASVDSHLVEIAPEGLGH